MEPFDLLQIVATALEAHGIPYLVTGSVATMVYGEPRFTHDIDIIAQLKSAQVDAFCAEFPEPDFYVSTAAARDAIRDHSQFNILQLEAGLKVDVIVPDDSAFNQSRLSRGRRIEAAKDVLAWFSAPEDVIIKKLEFFRDKHLRDVAAVVSKGTILDRDYINHWVTTLGITTEWNAVLEKLAEKK